MKQITKKITFLLVLMALLASPVWAKSTTQNVANTIHNLSSTSTYFFYQSDNVDEVCVFCHTPHGGLLTGPLWNHSLPAANTFTHYNSATISSYLSGLSVSRDINDESLLCMACHDGSVGVSHLINDPNSLNGAPPEIVGDPDAEIQGLFGQTGGRIGASLADTFNETGNLSDDHPISFSYDDVFSEYAGGSRDGELRPVGNTGDGSSALGWKGEGVRFFGATNRVECSSCHDPHVDYVTDTDYTPFLIRPNTGSDLCLACHNK
ncbi:MAG: cytochrome c3 family protein [Desulfuromonadales bacterium]|nr:cytochrome c3 family protein [Desulfuromonadales bacterium]